MTVDPKNAAELDAIDQQAGAAVNAAAQAITAAQAASTAATSAVAHSKALRALLDTSSPPPPPPPPPPETAPSWSGATAVRKDASTITISYAIAGSLTRVDQIGGIQGVPRTPAGPWQNFPVPAVTGSAIIDATVGTSAQGEYWLQLHDTKSTGSAAWVTAHVPFPQWGQPPPPPPPPPPVTGKIGFGTDAANNPVFTIDDKPTVLIGCNGSGQHGYWGGGLKAAGHSSSWAGWGWNFLRLFEQDPGGGECGACPDANNPETTAQVIAEYTGKGIVVMLDYHQFDFGSELTSAHIAKAAQRWSSWAAQFKGNPLVMFEAFNEPEATFHSYAHGATDWQSAFDMMCQRWLAGGRAVIDAVRTAGAENVIVFDDAQAGQGCDDFWSIGPSSGSAIIAVGRQLVDYDPLHRVAFTVHTYDAFGWGGPGEQNNQCEPRYTDGQRDARLLDYVRRVYNATGRPLIAGEFGWQNGESATTGSGFHYPYTKCGSRTLRAQQATTRIGAAASLSTAQWNGFQLTTNGNNGFDSSSLTACGRDYMAYCQKLKGGPIATAVMAEEITDRLVISEDETRALLDAAPPRPARGSIDEFGLYRPRRLTNPPVRARASIEGATPDPTSATRGEG